MRLYLSVDRRSVSGIENNPVANCTSSHVTIVLYVSRRGTGSGNSGSSDDKCLNRAPSLVRTLAARRQQSRTRGAAPVLGPIRRIPPHRCQAMTSDEAGYTQGCGSPIGDRPPRPRDRGRAIMLQEPPAVGVSEGVDLPGLHHTRFAVGLMPTRRRLVFICRLAQAHATSVPQPPRRTAGSSTSCNEAYQDPCRRPGHLFSSQLVRDALSGRGPYFVKPHVRGGYSQLHSGRVSMSPSKGPFSPVKKFPPTAVRVPSGEPLIACR